MSPLLSFLFALVISAVSVFSYCAAQYVQWGPISCNASYSATNISSCALLNVPVNIDPTVVTITSGDLNCSGFSFCLQRYLGIPHPSRWTQCTHFYNVSAFQPTSISFNLSVIREGDYMAAVYPLGNVPNDTHTVSISLHGRRCADGMAGPHCNQSIEPVNPNHSLLLNASSSGAYLTTKIPLNAASLNLTVTSHSNQTIDLFAREGSLPQIPGQNDAEGKNVLTVAVPSPGDWYFALMVNDSSENTNLTLFTQQCNASLNEGGPTCSYPITDITSLAPSSILKFFPPSNSWTYFKYIINNSSSPSLWFTVAPLNPANTTLNTFQVYVRYGVVPTLSQADFVGCSEQYCPVNVVRLPVSNSAQGPWYIGVLSFSNATGPFAIWIESVCGNNCSGNGACNTEGPSTGLCSCEIGFSLVDCSFYQFPTSYIVLIVMGSLVALSALIGFIGFLVVRKKNKQYEEIN